MTRVYRVEKSRVERHCHAGHAIPVGSAYNHATPGFRGRTIYACPAHPFRPSNLTANSTLSDYYGAVEALEDDLEKWDGGDVAELVEAVETAKSAVEDCTSEWESQLENMGVLVEGDTGQVIQERLDYANEWIESLERASSDLSEHDDEDPGNSDGARQIVEDAIAESQL